MPVLKYGRFNGRPGSTSKGKPYYELSSLFFLVVVNYELSFYDGYFRFESPILPILFSPKLLIF